MIIISLLVMGNGVLFEGRSQFFTPNDPYFKANKNFAGQWNLSNNLGLIDINVAGAWRRGCTGQGVVIGMIEQDIQTDHPDLADNYRAELSAVFASFSAPADHGTAVTGIAVARGGNGRGITGVAPFAQFAAIRFDTFTLDYGLLSQAVRHKSQPGDAVIPIKNMSFGSAVPYESPQDLYEDAFRDVTSVGTILVMSAGNTGRQHGDVFPTWVFTGDVNTMPMKSLPDVIVVGAVQPNGKATSTSAWGANVFVVAPTSWEDSDKTPAIPIITTDLTGRAGFNGHRDSFTDKDYTLRFGNGATSATAPLVSGVLALAKQVQPDLDMRWAKHLIVRTSQVVDENESSFASDGGWITNAAGNRYNQRYGFGVIDADVLTQLAERSTGVSPLETEHTGTIQANVAIPDNDGQGVELPFTINRMTTLEEIVITLDISHSYRGQLEAYLTSPSGTRSRLFARSEGVIEGFEIDANRDGKPDNGDFNADIKNWKFTSNAFWGENPQGQWILTVIDLFPGERGRVNFYAAEARMGKLLSEAPRTLSY